MKLLCNGGYELVGSGGEYDAGSTDDEDSHRPSNLILDGKMRTSNENDDNDDDKMLGCHILRSTQDTVTAAIPQQLTQV